MHPTLVIGLGNTLAGDDGVGVRVVEALARERGAGGLAVDFLVAGDDLLGAAGAMAGRRHVVLVDAIAGDPVGGLVEVYDEPFEGLDSRTPDVHALSAVACANLLKAADTGVAGARFTLLGVVVDGARLEPSLSGAMQARLPEVVALVRDYLRRC